MEKSVVRELRSVYQGDPVAQAILDVMATYVRGLYSIKTHMMEVHLAASGHTFQRSEIIAAFRKLEQVGIGKYVEGRRGWKSRFELVDRVTVIAKLVHEKSIDDLDLNSIEIEEEEAEETLVHSFHLRQGWTVHIELPADLTTREAKRLSQFIACLSIDEEDVFEER